jgi:hypothetical protein
MRKQLLLLVLIPLVLTVLVVGAWKWFMHATDRDEGIELDKWSADPKVQNGRAYDRAFIDRGTYTAVVVPGTAKVKTIGQSERIEIYMEKSLHFGGHPPEPMSIRQARKHMGCACRVEQDKLLIATYGEWDSHIEGRASMGLLLRVPEGLRVETRDDLSGEDSAGREWHGAYLTKPKEVTDGYWYGPASPAEGWTAVPSVPDPAFTAKGVKHPPTQSRTERALKSVTGPFRMWAYAVAWVNSCGNSFWVPMWLALALE